MKDGKIIAAAEEERFNRIKHSVGLSSPLLATQFCLDYAGITKDDVDYVVLDSLSPPHTYRQQLHKMLNLTYMNSYLFSGMLRYLYSLYSWKLDKNPFRLKDMGFPASTFRFVRHHDAHAASAFLCSGFATSDVLVIDGVGETDATSWYRGEGESITSLKRTSIPDSLGFFYGGITVYLGYEFSEGEGKVMGLAPYGEQSPYYEMMKTICMSTTNGYKMNPKVSRLDKFPLDMARITGMFGDPPTDKKNLHKQKKFRDIAWALQKRLEETVLELLTHNNVGDRLSLAGGVALNCKMNGILLRESGIKDIFIQPASHDGGGSLGAALEFSRLLGYHTKHRMEDVYLGPEYSNDTIEALLDNNKIKYHHYKDIERVAAELLAKNNVVGWFQGRMEFGPRALGNRSILMSPMVAANKDKINNHVKFREPYRPFCPSMLAEAADEYLEDAYPSPFMILSFQVKEEKQKEIPAVVHVDGSCRPQTVVKSVNPRYWKLIKHFEQESSVPVVLNTSMNIKGEPMVCTPKEALSCFFNTGMDYLILGNYLIKK